MPGTGPPAGRWNARHLRVLLGAGALALVAALVVVLALPGQQRAAGAMPTNPAIEQRYGVRFTLVGVTADRGLVDVRFVVLDPDRAMQMMSTPDGLPRLVVERLDKALPSAALMPMHQDLIPGRTYYVLYRNSGGVVGSGDTVTLAFKQESLRHVVVH